MDYCQNFQIQVNESSWNSQHSRKALNTFDIDSNENSSETACTYREHREVLKRLAINLGKRLCESSFRECNIRRMAAEAGAEGYN